MTPARLLAPAALVVAAIALFAVVSSGSDAPEKTEKARPASTPTSAPSSSSKAKQPKATPTGSGRVYTVRPGDSPYSIAQANGIEVDELLAANPDADANALHVGQKLKLP